MTDANDSPDTPWDRADDGDPGMEGDTNPNASAGSPHPHADRLPRAFSARIAGTLLKTVNVRVWWHHGFWWRAVEVKRPAFLSDRISPAEVVAPDRAAELHDEYDVIDEYPAEIPGDWWR